MSAMLAPSRDVAPPRRGRRSLAAAAVAAGLALGAATVVGLVAGPDRVTPVIEPAAQVTTSDWGSPELFDVVGSHILSYRHDTQVELRVPWDGAPVVDARLGDGDVHLLTVTDVAQDGDELVLSVHRGNCRFFHEREIDMFPGVALTLASGSTTDVLFDRPVFVKSPMLAACPDRTINRQDDTRRGA